MHPRLLRLLPVLFACCALAVLLWVNTAVGAVPAPLAQVVPAGDTPLSSEQLEQFWQELYPQQVEPAGVIPPVYVSELLAKAVPDECYNGIGIPYTGTAPICPDGQPKVNQAYVWGLTAYSTTTDNTLWFGTAPNVHCLVLGGYLRFSDPFATDSYVCEFGASQIAQTTTLTDTLGDWRPSKLYVYDVLDDTLSDVTPPGPLLNLTLGIRSAGTFGDHVFFGGPSFLGGVNLFLFDAQNRTFVGGGVLPGYNNIRKWILVDGVLYTAVGKIGGGGAVLRYTGDPTNPVTRFQFEEVGALDADGAEIALHEGRLFVNTWPSLTPAMTPTVAGLWMSPLLDGDGLNAADAGNWQKVFGYNEYEPDLVLAHTYGGGALISYGGDLFWGTMHVPFLSTLIHLQRHQAAYAANGGMDSEDILAAIFATQRAVTIFQGRDFGTGDEAVEVAYGLDLLPTFDPISATWTLEPNGIGFPKYGTAGINNLFNNYTWSMSIHDDQLFIGTMDWSYLLGELFQRFLNEAVLPPDIQLNLPVPTYGADLYVFTEAGKAAWPVSLGGVGNYTNYGIRNMVSDESGVYLGMANPMNLLTDPTDDKPEGGWELLHLSHLKMPIQVSIGGTGAGTVTSDPPGLNCTDSCLGGFNFGDEVYLTATPDVGSTFTGWEGSCSGSGDCGGVLLAPQAINAIFTLNTYTVTVGKAGDGAGRVVSTPNGIDCGTVCRDVLDFGSSLELTATAEVGSIFTGWSGACTGTATCTVSVTATKHVTATFSPLQTSIQVSGKLEAGLPISLTAILPIAPITTCTWNFGDGQTESCVPVAAAAVGAVHDITVQTTHVYTQPNTYVVTVTAGNAGGVVSASRVLVLLDPTAEAPVAMPDVRHGLYLPMMVK